MTPHVIIPDVNLQAINKFKNIFTNLTSIGIEDLEEFCSILEFDTAMFSYRERVNLDPEMEDNDMEEHLIESLMKDDFDLEGTELTVKLKMTNKDEENSTDYFDKDTEMKKFSETKQFTKEIDDMDNDFLIRKDEVFHTHTDNGDDQSQSLRILYWKLNQT